MMGNMSLTSYKNFSFRAQFPFIIKETTFIEGKKIVVIDLLVFPCGEDKWNVILNPQNDRQLLVRVAIPDCFANDGGARLVDEYALEGNSDLSY